MHGEAKRVLQPRSRSGDDEKIWLFKCNANPQGCENRNQHGRERSSGKPEGIGCGGR